MVQEGLLEVVGILEAVGIPEVVGILEVGASKWAGGMGAGISAVWE